MLRLEVISIAWLVFVPFIYAERVNVHTASKVAVSETIVMNARCNKAGLSSVTYSRAPTQPESLYDETGETLLAYVFPLEPEGFVVVTADDALVPVIAYSEHCAFPWEENSENILLNMLRQDLSLRLEAVPLTDEEVSERNHRQWEGMIAGEPEYLEPGDSWPPEGSTWTGGWVETAWDQHSPYNDLCPIDPETGERCVVGCTGTAMAQIVNYWEYPSSVQFTEDDNYISSRNNSVIPIHAPDASIPLIDYNKGQPSEEMCAAICFAVGVSLKMDYSPTGSGAWPTQEAFLKHLSFLYADEINVGDTSGKGLSFYQTLEDNMKDSKPALLMVDGQHSLGLHSVVCDGYRETYVDKEWHINYGWGTYWQPYPDCWYVLPEGLPFEYNEVRGGILNIEPPTRYVKEPIEKLEVVSCAPNPFEEYVRIIYTLPEESNVKVDVYDVSGYPVRNLADRSYPAGVHGVCWTGKEEDGDPALQGFYLIRIKTDSDKIVEKVMLSRRDTTDSAVQFATPYSPCRPNPFRDEVRFLFNLVWESEIDVDIFDSDGRCILHYPSQTYGYGEQEFRWDGKDMYGNPVSPGVYFIRVSTASFSYFGKVILIR
ncbi:C10 family peptidase [candidate division WOR-3 bacterium]|nr:C10 family peptidase [candidate division WOR-3 bacterium]